MIPLFSALQVRDADNYAVNQLGIPSILLMENASRSICQILIENLPADLKNNNIGIVCGKGNNGGDGFAVARHLLINNFNLFVTSLGSEEELKGDALANFRILKNILVHYPASKLTVYESLKDLANFDNCSIIVDAMLGTGSRGELVDPYKSIVERINKLDSFKVAIDLPTGLDLNNSDGDIIFDPDLTITLAELKSGLFYGKGYVKSGNIIKGSIGIGDEYFSNITPDSYLIEPEDSFLGIPVKELDQHKYSSGKVLVIAGSGSMPGAALLTANSVFKVGAGACYLAFPKSIKAVAQAKLDVGIVHPYEDEGKEFLSKKNIGELSSKIDWADIIVLGPGLGREEETKIAVLEILKNNKNKNIVIDADALFSIADGEYKKVNLKGKIVTPHHQEFARLIGVELAFLEKNILGLAKEFSLETGAYLVLKGAPTIIFNPHGEVFINSAGNPGLAKFGSGDVLSGVIAGFLSQTSEIEEALISAVYIHSLAADMLLEKKTEYGFTALDLIEELPYAIKLILKSYV